MKRFISVILILLIISTQVLAYNPDDYINISTPTSPNLTNKLISYIEKKKTTNNNSVFCIGQDKITYHMTYMDNEKDYEGLAFNRKLLPNSSLSEQEKKIKTSSIQIMYKHDPSIYDNPVATSGLSGNWYKANISWDNEKGKWKIIDEGQDILFEAPTDDKRGVWEFTLKGTDSTGKPLFDKESQGIASFRVHKAPVPRFSFVESGTTATLSDNGSYDIDYQYRKPDNGIKEYYWSAKVGGEWLDVGTGKTVTFNKNGKPVTDYRLTVEDWDGAFASISKGSLILEKPIVDFEFKVGGNTTTYVYKGNSGNETILVQPNVSWNDEAYDPNIYITSGTRTEKWTALKTSEFTNGYSAFNQNILKLKFNQIIQNNLIPVELEAKNKYDYFATKQRAAQVVNITDRNLTNTLTNHCGILVGTQATIRIELPNNQVNLDEINLQLVSSYPGFSTINMIKDTTNPKTFIATIPLHDVFRPHSNLTPYWDKFNYEVKIYSKRTGELLHKTSLAEILIHTPLDLAADINGVSDGNVEINTDELFNLNATTLKYAETVLARLDLDIIDISTNRVIKAGNPIYLTPNSDHTAWNKQLMIDSNSIANDIKVNAEFEAIAFNQRDRESVTVGFNVVSFRLENFRIVKVRDLKLEGFYKNYGTGKYNDIPMYVDKMAIDATDFQPYPISYLTKGYVFEFEIDSINFNDDADQIYIVPSFYAITDRARDSQAKEAYWIDSNKKVLEVGSGGHSKYATITLTKNNRTITTANKATWRGEYYIPGTTFLTNPGTTAATAKSNDLKSDIIVNFDIEGLKNGVPKFNYNYRKWDQERNGSNISPYELGDVIRYKGDSSNLNDLQVNRTQ